LTADQKVCNNDIVTLSKPLTSAYYVSGQQPCAAPVTLDTYVDEDASADTPPVTRASDTLVGATSADVHDGLGHPGHGMSSKELRHDGQPGRKKQGQGTDQFGQGRAGDTLDG
jgi:hypothetical protein